MSEEELQRVTLSKALREIAGKSYERQQAMQKTLLEADVMPPDTRPLVPLRGVRTGLLSYLVKQKVMSAAEIERFIGIFLGAEALKMLKRASTKTDRNTVYEYALLLMFSDIAREKDTKAESLFLFQPAFRYIIAALRLFKLPCPSNHISFNDINLLDLDPSLRQACTSLHEFIYYDKELYMPGVLKALSDLMTVKPVEEMGDRGPTCSAWPCSVST